MSTITYFSIPVHHIRIHRSLELHLFDQADNRIGQIPLLDQLVTLNFETLNSDLGPTYFVNPDAHDPAHTYFVNLPIELPDITAEYYDSPNISFAPDLRPNDWFFHFGFARDPENNTIASLQGIGTVDIADISINPDRPRRRSWLYRLFFPKRAAASQSQGLIGLPTHFPNALPMRLSIRLNFKLHDASHILPTRSVRIGIFKGQFSPTGPQRTFLLIGADPQHMTYTSKVLYGL